MKENPKGKTNHEGMKRRIEGGGGERRGMGNQLYPRLEPVPCGKKDIEKKGFPDEQFRKRREKSRVWEKGERPQGGKHLLD